MDFFPADGDCGAVCMPVSRHQEYMDSEIYAAQLYAHIDSLELEIRALRQEKEAAEMEAARWREEATRPPPLIERPAVNFLGGVAATALGGWAVGQAGR